jgi:hypothetical protein
VQNIETKWLVAKIPAFRKIAQNYARLRLLFVSPTASTLFSITYFYFSWWPITHTPRDSLRVERVLCVLGLTGFAVAFFLTLQDEIQGSFTPFGMTTFKMPNWAAHKAG